MKKISILAFAICLSIGAVNGQSKTVKDFQENSNGYNLYLYQSLIRMLNMDKNPEFNMLIRDLDHLRVVTTDSTGVAAKTKFVELDSGVQAEGFEELMSLDNKDYKCRLYELVSRRGTNTWVATFLVDGRAGIMEMKGSIDFKYINSLSSLNMDKLKELSPAIGENWD